ncbi:MAG: hypothetical protein N4A47_06190 [Clostridia bacterium]|jgi:hypothetical protein|nr:hypothetical protein [Clostridia bacterium]
MDKLQKMIRDVRGELLLDISDDKIKEVLGYLKGTDEDKIYIAANVIKKEIEKTRDFIEEKTGERLELKEVVVAVKKIEKEFGKENGSKSIMFDIIEMPENKIGGIVSEIVRITKYHRRSNTVTANLASQPPDRISPSNYLTKKKMRNEDLRKKEKKRKDKKARISIDKRPKLIEAIGDWISNDFLDKTQKEFGLTEATPFDEMHKVVGERAIIAKRRDRKLAEIILEKELSNEEADKVIGCTLFPIFETGYCVDRTIEDILDFEDRKLTVEDYVMSNEEIIKDGYNFEEIKSNLNKCLES